MKNILVTGGAGFIGTNFIKHTLKEYPDVRIWNLDALTYAANANIGEMFNILGKSDAYSWTMGDICDRWVVDRMLTKHNIDTIVHFAAETHVDRSINDAGVFIETNVMGTYSLLEAASQTNCHFHHISTDEVYGSLGKDDPPFTEKTPYAPNSPYSASKAASDHLVRAYHHTYGLPVTITNCSNNYGPYQHREKFIPTIITNAINGKPIPIYGDGKQVRDWMHVDDHCRAIDDVIRNGRVGETYNVGGGTQPTNIDIALTICHMLDILLPKDCLHKSLIKHVEDRLGHDTRYAVDYTKIWLELGWSPEMPLAKGLMETVKWYVERETA